MRLDSVSMNSSPRLDTSKSSVNDEGLSPSGGREGIHLIEQLLYLNYISLAQLALYDFIN